jgi:Zn-dependent protease with chaperone function
VIDAAVLALSAIALFGPVPVLLARAQWPYRSPRSAVILWQAMGLGGCLAAIGTGLAVAVAPLHTTVADGVERLMAGALAGHPLAGLGLNEALGLTLAADVTVVLAAGLVVTVVKTMRSRARHRLLLDLVAISSREVPGALVVEHPSPVAYCIPGLHGRIVLSAGALQVLGRPEVEAVIAHERGHTHARHDIAILPFASMVDLLRWMPYARLAPNAVATLLEMAADDFAARNSGAATVASALVHLADPGSGVIPACSFAAGDTAVVLRVRRLVSKGRGSRSVAALSVLAAGLVLATPVVTAVTAARLA